MGAYRDDAWEGYEHLNYAEEPDMDHVERAFKAGFDRGYEKGMDAPNGWKHTLDYIMARFPDLEWSEYSDPITALCDRLQAAEADK